MANSVLIVGPPGSGKSTAIKNLDPKTTFIICPDRKSLPIKGWRNLYKTFYTDDKKIDWSKTNYAEIDDPNQIITVLSYISANRPEITVIVLDTISHVMTSEFIKNAKQAGFQKFTNLAVDIYNIYRTIQTIRPDLTVIVTGHDEAVDTESGKKSKLRTIGKLLDEKVTIESLFTVVLFTSVDLKNQEIPYGFEVQTNGFNTAKSPEGMFPSSRIPNDYAYIVNQIKKYEN